MTVKTASFAYFLLLWIAHGVADPRGDRFGMPLSMFRDGPEAWLGYALFTALLVLALGYTAGLARAGAVGEAGVSGLASLLLLLVAATPSQGPFHLFSSGVLLLLLYGHYGLLLLGAGVVWLALHLTVPVALAVVTAWEGYGVWQKSLIGYFVLAAVVRHHLLGLPAGWRWAAVSRGRVHGHGLPSRRRKVFQVEAGREWARRQLGEA